MDNGQRPAGGNVPDSMAANIEGVKRAGVTIDIDALAADGFASITDDDRYRLKTQGVCAQRHVGVFMLRIRVPGGRIEAAQLRAVAGLADRYGHPSLHVTSRAGLEIHHVRIENVPAVFEALAAAGLTTKGACGDTVRNVVACRHGDARDGAILPLEPFAEALHAHIVARSDATNISRKMNPALACGPACDAHVATSDMGFVATPHPVTRAPGFALWGAGGLGATPRLAIQLADWLPPEDFLPAFDALVALGEKYGDRSSRAKAKIKLLVDRHGASYVRALFEEEFAAAKTRFAPEGGRPLHREHGGVAPDACTPTDRRECVPALVPMGELQTGAARMLADLAERFGDGSLYLTTDQNAELHGVGPERVAEAVALIEAAGLRTRGRGGITDVLACVGLEYCPLAITGSMTMGEELALALAPLRDDPRFADFRIHVSGCPHSCAKHQVADVGLAGALVEYEGRRVKAFVAYVGGNAHERRLGTAFAKKIPRPLVVPALLALLATYDREAGAGERFSQTVARTGTEPFFAALATTLDAALHEQAPRPELPAETLVAAGTRPA
jgi:sulfite reductase beta subunit-like hemoprotein